MGCMSTQPVVGPYGSDPGRGLIPDDSQFKIRLAIVEGISGWTNVKEAALACGLPVESYRGWRTKGRLPRNMAEVAEKICAATIRAAEDRRQRGEAVTDAELRGVDFNWMVRGSRSAPRTAYGVAAERLTARTVNDRECTVRDSNPEPAVYDLRAHRSLILLGNRVIPITRSADRNHPDTRPRTRPFGHILPAPGAA